MSERRKYIRLDSVFPVQFQLLAFDGKTPLSSWQQGFTSNVGEGGLCLEIINPDSQVMRLLQEKGSRVSLEIELPFKSLVVPASGFVAWIKGYPNRTDRFLVGVGYKFIDAKHNRLILHYARTRRLVMPLAVLTIILLAAGFIFGSYWNFKLIRGNRALVNQLVSISQESEAAKQQTQEIYFERSELIQKVEELSRRIKEADDEQLSLRAEKIQDDNKITQLNTLIKSLVNEKNEANERLIGLRRKELDAEKELLLLDKKRANLEQANLDKMYLWLKSHQSGSSGLVVSFEGTSESKDWAFIYDQSLALQAYAYFGDFARCQKMLDFFSRAKREEGWFFNAYYASDGSPAEFIRHCGPNLWLGIGILQYTQKSQDRTYLHLAEEIAQAVMGLQREDPDGGLRGGPKIAWYSTEHNLDAYAFFDMLEKITGRQIYAQTRDKIFNWILKNTYGKSDLPVKRGKGDSTIATDTYAWSIAAIGPQKLKDAGMDPDSIMDFAEQHCAKEVIFKRPEGYSIQVRGFDFAPERNLPRGGVVSPEWTAQMVISFQILADYHKAMGSKNKAVDFQKKADSYLANLAKMVISSPSPSGQGNACLPYATQEQVDTGHGWQTPRGSSTGSVAGTAYTIFAYHKYNPLSL